MLVIKKLIMILALLSLPLSVFAMTIDEAKLQGYIGEQSDGYLGIVNPAVPADVIDEMNKVNEKRRDYYESVAKNNNIPQDDVENMAGSKLVNRANQGEYVRYQDSEDWKKK